MNLSAKEIAKAVHASILCGDPMAMAKNIETDSHKACEGSLFVPIIGKRTDGHLFIKDAFRGGASISFSSEGIPGDVLGDEAIIGVKDTLKALLDLGTYFRERYASCPFVGITGSVGKTTTREMTAAALSSCFKTYATKGNANSQVGVPITVCLTPSDTQIGVIELGVSEIGEMERIAAVARPDSAIITRIGESHIAQFGSKKVTLREKLHIADYIDGGMLLVNGEDPLLREISSECELRSFGMGDGADYRAVNIKRYPDSSEYDFLAGGEKIARVRLSVPGDHMILNSLAAMGMALYCGADPEAAALRLKDFRGVSGRFEMIERNGVRVINDAYNASPESMREGLRTLELMEGKRRIAVIADMLELGEREGEFHSEIGRLIANELTGIDIIYLFGGLSEYTLEALSGFGRDVRHFDSVEELTSSLKKEIREGDTLFFKGSNSMGLFKVSEEICSTL